MRRGPPLYPDQFVADTGSSCPHARQNFANARLRVAQLPQRFTNRWHWQRWEATPASGWHLGSE
jgi:hypothetical protein